MDERELEAKVAELLKQDRYSEAEDLLRQVHAEATQNNRVDLAICSLQELKALYILQERLSDEKWCQLEIEKRDDCAWSFVSSSWFYLYSKQDFRAALAKADDAIAKARVEGDTSTLYTALAARGQALIKLERSGDAEGVLAEMLGMVSQRKKLVPGDELRFLRMAYEQGLARETVAEILKIVRPLSIESRPSSTEVPNLPRSSASRAQKARRLVPRRPIAKDQ